MSEILKTLKCINIKKTLLNYSNENSIDINYLDFNIAKSENFLLVNRALNLYDPIEDDKLELSLEKEFDIFQIHSISIFENRDKKNHFPFKLKSKNQKFTKIVAELDTPKMPKYYDDFFIDLKRELNKRLAYNSFLIDICSFKSDHAIKEFVEFYKKDELEKKSYEIVMCDFKHPKEGREGKLILHYLDKIQKDEKGEIDHTQRGFGAGISEGETILEFIKPKFGTSGRDCYGRFLKRDEIDWNRANNKLEMSASEGVYIEEDDESVKYLAQKSGFIRVEHKSISIHNELRLQTIDYKSTGSIQGGKDGKIEVNSQSAYQDSIGDSVEVVASEVQVRGNIGAAVIKTNLLNAKGMIHSKAKIEAKEADLNILKGELKCTLAKIRISEGGRIYGDEIDIGFCTNSEISGESITIRELGSNNKIFVSRMLKIISQKGEDNKIVADSSKSNSKASEALEIDRKIDSINGILKQDELKRFELNDELYFNNKLMVYIKEKIEGYKIKDKKAPKVLALMFENSNKRAKEINDHLVNIQNATKCKRALESELVDMKKGVYDIRVINQSNWVGSNSILFELPNEMQVEKHLEGSSQIIYLRDDEQNTPQIVVERYFKG